VKFHASFASRSFWLPSASAFGLRECRVSAVALPSVVFVVPFVLDQLDHD
jgi:hypothetical protein